MVNHLETWEHHLVYQICWVRAKFRFKIHTLLVYSVQDGLSNIFLLGIKALELLPIVFLFKIVSVVLLE